VGLIAPLDRFPFVPDDPARLDQDCYEAFNIQVQGLSQAHQATKRSTSSSASPAGWIPPTP
jgi:NAD+ synthase (glutamine-hydrolysing)